MFERRNIFLLVVVIIIFNLQFLCEPNSMYKIQKNLEKFNYVIVCAEEEHIALQKVSLNELEFAHLTKFINNVQGLQDVIEIYDNIA